jgi:hypothetical protein
MLKNASNPQLLLLLALVYAGGMTIWALIARGLWSLLSWGEIVAADPTWSGSFAIGACLFFLRMLFTSPAKTK